MADDKPPPGNPEPVVYRLDRDDVIVEVGGEWDHFAMQNDGAHLCQRSVLGRPLESFVSGDATRMFVRALLQAARLTLRPLTRDYRCDSADLRRYMRMTIAPEADGGLRVSHALVRTVPYAHPVPVRYAMGNVANVTIRCSMCNRLRDGGEWREADSVPPLAGGVARPVIYGVCPDCMTQIRLRSPGRVGAI